MQERLEALERTVAELAREVRELRAALDGTAAGSSSLPPAGVGVEPVVVRPAGADADRRTGQRRSGAPRRAVDFESLVGRYGTLALASLTILMGVGAFLGWAIAHGKIGPGARVGLGALAAAVVAVAGWRLRAQGSRRFGSTLLALALALVHVDAWGAGPYLHLVPEPLALSVAAAASVALAVLAWCGSEEALFSVGVGGALLAPFVTSSESGSARVLLAYGYVVLACGLIALRGRAWRAAATVAMIGVWLYTAAAAGATEAGSGVVERNLPAAFALAAAWTALVATRGPWGATIARSALVALLGVLAVTVAARAPAADVIVLAAVGTVTAYLTGYGAGRSGDGGDRPRRDPLFTAAFLPMALGTVAVFAASGAAVGRALIALAWAGGAVIAAASQPALRPAHLMVAGIASGAAVLLALEGRAVASCVALSAHAAGLSLLLRREGSRLIGVPIALGLAIVTFRAFDLLAARPLYEYTPFLTGASLAAAAMSAAWLVVSWHASRTELAGGGRGGRQMHALVRLAGAVVTFLWARAELARAYSPDVATFLLILYYAAAGVAAIFIGRRRRISVLRHSGLALAMFAALKAIAQSSSLAIGLRVGSYFLAGLFLLAVAYWYREREADA